MRSFFLASCLLFILQTSFSQIVIEGKVLEQKSRKPIPFANIGVFKSNVGTLSNMDGSFSLRIPGDLKNDSVSFSSIGFEKKSYAVTELQESSSTIVYLKEKPTVLKEITVRQKKEAPKILVLGNTSMKGGVMEADTLYAGRSMSLLIDNQNPKPGCEFPLYVSKASLRILRNNLKSVRFRMRIQRIDSSGAPGDDLLQKNIIVEATMRKGWLDFDLSHLKFVVTQPFFVTFEQLTTKDDRIAIAEGYRTFKREHPERIKYDTVLFEGKKVVRMVFKRGGIDLPGTFIAVSPSWQKFTSYVREASFGDWKKVRGIFTATVTLSNQAVSFKTKAQSPCADNSVDCEAEKMCKDFLDETGMAGMQIFATAGGKIKLSRSFGYSDIENKIPVTDSTKFRIASISKAVSSAALIKLVSEGKIDLDVPIQNYIPQFPEKKYPITTRQLAGHLSGFRDYISVNDLVHHEHYDNATQALRVFEKDTLLFKPGSKFYYSFFGWSIIGAIIESVSQKDYLTYMKENVFKPMQLKNTCGDNIKMKISNRSRYYDATGQEKNLGDLSYKYSTGGLLSTAEDLVRFGNAVLHETNKVDQELLFTSQKTLDGSITGYGLGWYVGIDKNGHRYWHHSGDSFNSSSHLLIYPDDDVVIAFLANGQEGAAFDIEKVAALFFKK
jgi:CubicO group peptidase (beta-lactamase class C family)